MEEEYKAEQLERLLRAVERVYHRPGQIVWRGFLIGLASGAGGVVGAVLIVILIGFLIRWLGGLPVIGEWLINVGRQLPAAGP